MFFDFSKLSELREDELDQEIITLFMTEQLKLSRDKTPEYEKGFSDGSKFAKEFFIELMKYLKSRYQGG